MDDKETPVEEVAEPIEHGTDDEIVLAFSGIAQFIGRAIGVQGDLDALENLSIVKAHLHELEEKIKTLQQLSDDHATATEAANQSVANRDEIIDQHAEMIERLENRAKTAEAGLRKVTLFGSGKAVGYAMAALEELDGLSG